jgi:hypothetical protein
MYTIAKPMAIAKNHQYSLSTIAFDPIQNSPPCLWKMRLNKRIEQGSKGKPLENPTQGASPLKTPL